MTESNRNSTIDVIKGFAIILVIIGHCIQFGSGVAYLDNGLFFDNILFKLIYSFHMPLFMLVSGYLFYFTLQKYSFISVIISRIKSLLVPVLVWQTLWLIVGDNNDFSKSGVLGLFNCYLNTLWFISSVFINSIVVLLCNKYAHDSLFIYSSFMVASLFIPNYYGYNLYVFMLPFFLCGYFFNKVGRQKIASLNNMPFFLFLLVLVFLILLSYFDRNDYVYTSGTFIIRNKEIFAPQILIDCYRWFIGLVGSLCVIITIVLLQSIKTLRFLIKLLRSLSVIGTKTMGLYIISTYCFQLFHLLPIDSFCYLYHILEFVMVICISYLLILLIEQNKYLRKYLLGGR